MGVVLCGGMVGRGGGMVWRHGRSWGWYGVAAW